MIVWSHSLLPLDQLHSIWQSWGITYHAQRMWTSTKSTRLSIQHIIHKKGPHFYTCQVKGGLISLHRGDSTLAQVSLVKLRAKYFNPNQEKATSWVSRPTYAQHCTNILQVNLMLNLTRWEREKPERHMTIPENINEKTTNTQHINISGISIEVGIYWKLS